MQIIHTFGHVFGGTLLVAGTSIGVGMLALPLATADGGFFPSLIIYALCWLFMLFTGLLILEACIWMPRDSNLVTLSSHLLGKSGKAFCWIVYLFLFTCLMIAHVSGGGNVVHQISAGNIPEWAGTIVYVLIFAPAVYLGTRTVDRLNLILMAGVLITYLLFVTAAVGHVNFDLLGRMKWPKAWAALPVVFTAFGYQSLIPTLMSYMNRNVKRVKTAIILGTAIPFIIYVIWEFLILGIIPAEGTGGLIEALHQGQNAVNPLGQYLHNSSLMTVGTAFAFFALTTSFVGISIAYVDFLADGLKVTKKGLTKLGLCAIIFLIPLIITLTNPGLFIQALNVAGGIGVALLLGVMPILMVWVGRYKKGHSLIHQQVPGGKAFLALLMAFIVFELIIEFAS